MLNKAKHSLTILAAKKLLDTNKDENLSTAKRLLSVVAGAYILQRGLRSLIKHPILAVQEVVLGGFLIYDAAKDIRNIYPNKPSELSQDRRNQIQGNDPKTGTLEFI
jgi:uncharacterized membrane protein